MSLINEMLRDLENRRRSGARQLPSGEQPIALQREFVSRRWLWLAAAGIALAGVVWGIAGRQLARDAATVPQVSVAAVATQETLAPETQVVANPVAETVAANERKTGAVADSVPPAAKKLPLDVVPEKPLAKVVTTPVAVSNETREIAPEPQPLREKRLSKKITQQTPQQQAEQLYQDALQQVQARNLPRAAEQLLQVLSLDPQLLPARLLAIDLLSQLRRPQAAEQVLAAGLRLQPDNFELRKRSARQLLQQGKAMAALAILQAAPLPRVAEDSEYHALLAALLRENAAYSEAVKEYRKLLAFRGREPLWWLGLALSSDQAGLKAQAKQAYRQALTLPGLQVDLIDYIKGRLQVL